MYDTLEIEQHGAIASLWLNRPEKLNALSLKTLQELARAAAAFNQQPEVRVVIVGGRGKAFSAGADLEGFPQAAQPGARAAADAGRVMAEALENMNAITLAQIQGWCVGGGLVLAAACDLRLAESTTQFSIPEIDLGIPLAWGGIPRLVREIGPALTRELVITCRSFDAEEALRAGFLNRVVEPGALRESVEALARDIAAKPVTPVMATKRHVDAVTSQMVGTDRAWSDADSLLAALQDAECTTARERYLQAQKNRGRGN
jgi:enoyl-CoA hydratase/carnithine racemase